MPSPFPGVDPYIEGQRWSSFHGGLVFTIRDILVPSVRPRYIVDAEERIYVHFEDEQKVIRPDVYIAEGEHFGSRRGAAPTAVALEPAIVTLPKFEESRERFIAIRDRESHALVTVIEVLSAANKRSGTRDHDAYIEKRNEVLWAGVNLVELDLLRGGRRMPTNEPLPAGDFFAIVCRGPEWPRAAAYHWTLRQSIPAIPIPLAHGDPDVPLDLQAAFTSVYDRSGYDYSLNYSVDPEPPLSDVDAEWAAAILKDATR